MAKYISKAVVEKLALKKLPQTLQQGEVGTCSRYKSRWICLLQDFNLLCDAIEMVFKGAFYISGIFVSCPHKFHQKIFCWRLGFPTTVCYIVREQWRTIRTPVQCWPLNLGTLLDRHVSVQQVQPSVKHALVALASDCLLK